MRSMSHTLKNVLDKNLSLNIKKQNENHII